MDGKDDTLHRIIVDLTRKNEHLEDKIQELESELKQNRVTLRVYRNRLAELKENL